VSGGAQPARLLRLWHWSTRALAWLGRQFTPMSPGGLRASAHEKNLSVSKNLLMGKRCFVVGEFSGCFFNQSLIKKT